LVSGGFFYNLSVSLLKIGEAYPRHKNKLTASTIKNVHPCSFFTCEICISQISFLIRTIAIRAENDTLRIYCSSGMDAAGLNRSDVSAMLKLAANSPKDGRGISQKQVLFQNLSSTDVHGRTSVERYTDVQQLKMAQMVVRPHLFCGF